MKVAIYTWVVLQLHSYRYSRILVHLTSPILIVFRFVACESHQHYDFQPSQRVREITASYYVCQWWEIILTYYSNPLLN